MSYIEVYVIVEGQTEQTFIRDVLAPNLAYQGIYLTAHLIGKAGHKGGNVKFERAKPDIEIHLKQRANTYVSTMFDYFRIDRDWPGLEKIKQRTQAGQTLTVQKKADILEKATFEQIQKTFPDLDVEKRFIPYIVMHEFEAFLFSNAEILSDKTEIPLKKINSILAKYNQQPEEINNTPENAPSKQIIKLTNGYYHKVRMGKVISESIGIPAIRQQCPHFGNWLSQLEELKNSQ